MIQREVNGKPVGVKSGATVLQACEAAGIEIPRFCYHERLLVAGNCRMCLVERTGSPKPVASCAMPVAPGMKVVTDSPRVKKAREGVMEFLLRNHPLDCPICDQAGECDLQDQSMIYGSDRSRMYEPKRGVEDKNRGPLVAATITRCIHCTRCIRFASEVAGVADLGTSARGVNTEVGTYITKMYGSERSGNLIDLCPVGALTSKPYSFKGRPWELMPTESVDGFDARGANVRLKSRNNEVFRVMPRLNDNLNGEWLADKSRFAVDGAKIQRILTSWVAKQVPRKGKTHRKEVRACALDSIATIRTNRGNTHPIQRVVSPTLDRTRRKSRAERAQGRRSKGFNVSLERVGRGGKDKSRYGVGGRRQSEQERAVSVARVAEADVCVRVGTDLRKESPLLNTKLRETFLRDQVKIYSLGNRSNPTYPVTHLDRTRESRSSRANGTHSISVERAKAKKPRIRVGNAVRERADSESCMRRLRDRAHKLQSRGKVVKGWSVLNLVHRSANSVGGRWLNYTNYEGLKENARRIRCGVNAGELKERGWAISNLSQARSARKGLVVLGTHGDELRANADVIIPRNSHREQEGKFMNMEGRRQSSHKATGDRSVSNENLVKGLSKRLNILDAMSVVDRDDNSEWTSRSMRGGKRGTSVNGRSREMTVPSVHDYYLEGHAMARVSPLMAKCSKSFAVENFS